MTYCSLGIQVSGLHLLNGQLSKTNIHERMCMVMPVMSMIFRMNSSMRLANREFWFCKRTVN